MRRVAADGGQGPRGAGGTGLSQSWGAVPHQLPGKRTDLGPAGGDRDACPRRGHPHAMPADIRVVTDHAVLTELSVQQHPVRQALLEFAV